MSIGEVFRVGVDIGGTFTDLMFLGSENTILPVKVPSTPQDYSDGVIAGIEQGCRQLGVEPTRITEIGHGFTIATNAILEGKGARTALVTTAGFRDVLEFRRNRVPRLYDLYYRKPETIVRRELRFEVRERMNHRGEVLVPVDPAEVDVVLGQVRASGAQALAICLLHSYANPVHEALIARRAKELVPEIIVTASSELLPVMKEYERTSTTVINCYVRPVVERYLDNLTRRLVAMQVEAPVGVMQSNGGLATPGAARARPVFCIESGPAAGVMGALHAAQAVGIADAISFDMGGTTAKASIIENSQVLMSQECEVGAGINVGHRLLRGAGHVIKVPSVDLAEVGAGGGSIAKVDASGSVSVGPASAGAWPGPACYGHGGTEATVTDANVALGYLNPRHLLGGAFPIHAQLGGAALERSIGRPLGLAQTEAAYGIHRLANATMSRALRAVSSERGRDPRRFTMVVFGGNGPVHAAGLAAMLGIAEVLVPRHPGVFSALGLVLANTEHHFMRTHFVELDRLDTAAANAILDTLLAESNAFLHREGAGAATYRILLDIKYKGQASELTVVHHGERFDDVSWGEMPARFDEEHERTFSFRSSSPKQLVNLRLVATVARGTPVEVPVAAPAVRGDGGAPASRAVYFGPEVGWRSAPIAGRSDLDASPRPGPLVIEEYDATTVVPPGWSASLDDQSNIRLRIG